MSRELKKKKKTMPKNKLKNVQTPKVYEIPRKQWLRWFFLIFIFGCLIINNKSAERTHDTLGMYSARHFKSQYNKEQSKCLCGSMKHMETVY